MTQMRSIMFAGLAVVAACDERPSPQIAASVRVAPPSGVPSSVETPMFRLWLERRGRLELLVATRQWAALESSADDVLREDPRSIIGLRMRGVALAMQGKRALALGVDSVLATATTPEQLADLCYGALPGACRRVARAYIAAALGDKACAVSLLDYRSFNDNFAHYELIGELLRDYPPFQEYIRNRG